MRVSCVASCLKLILGGETLGDLVLQLSVRPLQIQGALFHHRLQLGLAQVRFLPKLPLPGHGGGELADLGGVERLLEQQETVGVPEAIDEVFPAVV